MPSNVEDNDPQRLISPAMVVEAQPDLQLQEESNHTKTANAFHGDGDRDPSSVTGDAILHADKDDAISFKGTYSQ